MGSETFNDGKDKPADVVTYERPQHRSKRQNSNVMPRRLGILYSHGQLYIIIYP